MNAQRVASDPTSAGVRRIPIEAPIYKHLLRSILPFKSCVRRFFRRETREPDCEQVRDNSVCGINPINQGSNRMFAPFRHIYSI